MIASEVQGCTECGVPHSSTEPHRTRFETPTGLVVHTPQDLFNIYNDRLDRIEQRQDEIRESIIRTEEMVQKFIAALTPVIDDLIPMVTNFAENPLIKMALRGKK